MPRRPKSADRPLPLLLWIGPLVALVLTPLYLHAAAREVANSTNEHESTALALLLAVVSLSVFGCVADQGCKCNKKFPVVISVVQILIVVSVVIMWPPLLDLQQMAPVSLHAPHFRNSALQRAGGVHRELQLAGPDTHAREQSPLGAAATMEPTTTSTSTKQVKAVPGLPEFRDSGDGFCEDGDTGEEFSSLHSTGISFESCGKVALGDRRSLGFDFSPSNGGCDVRYAVGVDDPRMINGYSWWGWGGGAANPKGSGKTKHDSVTHCYAKIVQPTTAPLVAPHMQGLSDKEKDALIGKGKDRWSVVLPCASENNFMVKTVQSFCDRTPPDVLHEIIVVDDGSSPPLQEMLTGIEARCKLKVLRHTMTLGLMIAKQTGGDAATGEFIGFFDCHVAPNRIWHQEMRQILMQGPRRMVVPLITDLNLDTWDEKENSQVNTKCYIDFNGNFMWFDSATDYIPVISGGLVALSRAWWIESGGFDDKMRGWGGENLDQSLRTWLCGGEIWRAKTSRIAHMWRVADDPRTAAHYKRVTFGVNNLARVAAGWFDKFVGKFNDGLLVRGRKPDVSNYESLKQRLQCKPYAFFLHRFRKIYHDGGVLPTKVFKVRSVKTKQCMNRRGASFAMAPCQDASWMHGSNQHRDQGWKCCSGLRQWNAMECLDRLDANGPLAYWCDVAGHNDNQQYHWHDDGLIHHPLSNNCLSVSPDGNEMVPAPCQESTKWERIEEFKPVESTTYEEEVQRLGLRSDAPDD